MAEDFPPEFDPIYFKDETWGKRRTVWLQSHSNEGFSEGNSGVVDELLRDEECGLRMVVNIGNAALLSVLEEGRYRNLYESPEIGGEPPKEVSETREKVDGMLGLDEQTYFGAVALGGSGVRYYGEYCMVLTRDAVDKCTTELFDRDSYDILVPPLADLDLSRLIARLKGKWKIDLEAMVAMKVLPELVHERRLVTSGTVSEAVLRDQEFIEVHLRGPFAISDIEEIRESPDEVAIEARIADKQDKGRFVSAVEAEWVRRRDEAAAAIDRAGIPTRVVTMHGRGYQWR